MTEPRTKVAEPGELDEALTLAIDAKGARPGRLGVASGLGSLLGVALIAWVVWQLGPPVRDGFAALNDEGDVAAIAPKSTASALTEDARRAAFLHVRRAALEHFRAHEGLLAPIVERSGPPRDPALGLRRLAAWRELKLVWARALAAEGLAPSDYHALASELAVPAAEESEILDLLLSP